MKKLTKDDILRREDLNDKLKTAAGKIEDAQKLVETSITEMNIYIEAYNEIVSEVSLWRDDITGQMEDHMSEKSDKWNESDTGQLYDTWKSDFENLDAEPIDQIDVPEFPAPTLAEELLELPEEPDKS